MQYLVDDNNDNNDAESVAAKYRLPSKELEPADLTKSQGMCGAVPCTIVVCYGVQDSSAIFQICITNVESIPGTSCGICYMKTRGVRRARFRISVEKFSSSGKNRSKATNTGSMGSRTNAVLRHGRGGGSKRRTQTGHFASVSTHAYGNIKHWI